MRWAKVSEAVLSSDGDRRCRLLLCRLMGRGRGKGKKTIATSHEDLGSGGEEVLLADKRRGRPQKPLKEDDDEEDIGNLKEEEGDIVKTMTPEKGVKGLTVPENGKERKRSPHVKENSSLVLEESGNSTRSNSDESTRFNGFRQNGSGRKSTPRRAAEAVVECQ